MIISYGVTEKGFYMVQKFEDYYAIWMVDAKPKKLDQTTLMQFLEENENDGWGVSGTFEQVMDDLKDFLCNLATPALEWPKN